MRPPARELLATWERGQYRHPLDRALLLYALAEPAAAPAGLADRPLGLRNTALLALRRSMFGRHLRAGLDCPACLRPLEITLDLNELCAQQAGVQTEVEVQGQGYRVPTTRDLAAIAAETDVDAAARRLLASCRLDPSDDPATAPDAQTLADIETAWEDADPNADIALDLTCGDCGHAWQAEFDVPAFIWEEFASRAVQLLDEVHLLATAYGWTEAEILALSETRRAAYLDRVTA